MLGETTDPQLWSLASDRDGVVYAGSGNDGRIYKVDASGTMNVFVDTNELQVHALVVDRRGNLYAGTSPRGVVYRIDPSGAQEIFFDPEDRYIWALALDSLNNLLVATGDEAQVHRVSRSGESEVLFTSEETPYRLARSRWLRQHLCRDRVERSRSQAKRLRRCECPSSTLRSKKCAPW